MTYQTYLIVCALSAAVAMLTGLFIGGRKTKARRAQDDDEQAESLNRYSEAKRAQKSVPIFLRKQAD